MKQGKKVFFEEMNIAKGITAVLVVLGHAIRQTGQTNLVFDILYSVIYSFHMPLFFFIAGFLSEKILFLSGGMERANYIRERFLRLLIPYFAVGVVYAPFKYLLAEFANEPYDFSSVWRIFLGENPDGALWFLYALFVISAAAGVLITKKNLNWILVFSLALMIGNAFIYWENDIVAEILFYQFFFLLGLAVRTKYDVLKNYFFRIQVIVICLAVFAVGNVIFFRYPLNSLTKGVTAVAGIVLSLFISNCIMRFCREASCPRRTVNLLGDYCMDIYILAEPIKTAAKILFWSVLSWNYIVCTFLCFLSAVVFSIIVSKFIVRPIPILRKAFLGMK